MSKNPETVELTDYQRYHIETELAPDIAPWPSRFRVKVTKHGLALHLIKETFHRRGNTKIIFSRPCIYGAYSGPVGGFAPRQNMCVGCLRCTTEHPEFVQIYRNPEREHLGDSYLSADHADTIHYEAETGRIPVKGAGYRGKFGGEGWDGMWTDMSEIVRPTRDGIHGREFISTVTDIGEKPKFLTFDEQASPIGQMPHILSLPLPILFDVPPASIASKTLFTVLTNAAQESETLAIVPLPYIKKFRLSGTHIVPLVKPEDYEMLNDLTFQPRMIELDDWDKELYDKIRSQFPSSLLCPRFTFSGQFQEKLLQHFHAGVRVFHLIADYHGHGANGEFILKLIRQAHQTLVDAGCRDEVTLFGSGGIIAAEHVPKAIICGLDAIALDTLRAPSQG